MELGSGVTKALLPSAKSAEVLSGLGYNIVIEVEVDSASLIWKKVNGCPLMLTVR